MGFPGKKRIRTKKKMTKKRIKKSRKKGTSNKKQVPLLAMRVVELSAIIAIIIMISVTNNIFYQEGTTNTQTSEYQVSNKVLISTTTDQYPRYIRVSGPNMIGNAIREVGEKIITTIRKIIPNKNIVKRADPTTRARIINLESQQTLKNLKQLKMLEEKKRDQEEKITAFVISDPVRQVKDNKLAGVTEPLNPELFDYNNDGIVTFDDFDDYFKGSTACLIGKMCDPNNDGYLDNKDRTMVYGVVRSLYDYNNDLRLDQSDLAVWIENYKEPKSEQILRTNQKLFDINNDGRLTKEDLSILTSIIYGE